MAFRRLASGSLMLRKASQDLIPTISFMQIHENGFRMARSIISRHSFIGRRPERARAFRFCSIGGDRRT